MRPSGSFGLFSLRVFGVVVLMDRINGWSIAVRGSSRMTRNPSIRSQGHGIGAHVSITSPFSPPLSSQVYVLEVVPFFWMEFPSNKLLSLPHVHIHVLQRWPDDPSDLALDRNKRRNNLPI